MTKEQAINKLLDKAASYIGYVAESGKHNIFAQYLDGINNYYNGKKDGFDWCECFVDSIFLMTFGNPVGREMIYQPEKSLGAACEYSANYYIKNNAWTTTPAPGLQAFIGQRGDEYHTGIVKAVNGKNITLIEGNAGDPPGRVMLRTWNLSDFSGFGVPKWELVEGNKPLTYAEKVDEAAKKLAQMAKDVVSGKYGNGDTRKAKLGEWYEPVQFLVNKGMQ